jgi:AcrR family transcriptional regulator
MERNADATRARLLAAARKEFAAYGIAGARVDRIAAEAGSNKAQIYHYFVSKDRLFDAVFTSIVEQVVDGVPFDPADLPGYAERLAHGNDEYPDIMRLATWHRLERGTAPLVQAAIDSNRDKIAAIARAQETGVLTARIPAGVLLALIIQTAAVWVDMPDELATLMAPTNPASRAELVGDAVRALLTGTPD